MFRMLTVVAILASSVCGVGTGSEANASGFGAVGAVDHLIEESGVRGGLIVHVGCGDGRLTSQMRVSEAFVVHGLDTDETDVAAARARIGAAGLRGAVSVAHWVDTSRLPYAGGFVDLLVADDLGDLGRDEVMRVLAPNGVALSLGAGAATANRRWPKEWPDEMDEWSHWHHGADANPVSGDRLVGPPREMQWIDGLPFSKKHWGPRISAMVTAGGRLFTVEDETTSVLFNLADKWVLKARNAFNGVLLWQRAVPDWARGVWTATSKRDVALPAPEGMIIGTYGEMSGGSGGRDGTGTMVATEEYLFVPLAEKEPLSMLEAATGKVVRTYTGTPAPREVRLHEGMLLISGGNRTVAVTPETGEIRWQTEGASVSAEGQQAYVVRAGGKGVACAGLDDGAVVWERRCTEAKEALGEDLAKTKGVFVGPLQVGAGVVLAPLQIASKNVERLVLSASDGRPLWRLRFHDRGFGRGAGPFILDGKIWTMDSNKGQISIMEPRTGAAVRTVGVPGIRFVGHHARCYTSRATADYIIGKERGVDFVDLASGEVTWNNWTRGPCRRGIIPANGLTYVGQHSCRCYSEAAIRGLHALARSRGTEGVARQSGSRLMRGPAFGKLRPSAAARPGGNDWPTYRHDAWRSGSTACAIPDDLTSVWGVDVAGAGAAWQSGRDRLSAPVVANGRVLVASVDEHTVCCFDASDGRRLWEFTAGGRVDSPATVFRGMALFGCRDGHVYCLRADTGALVWRFRAGPEDRYVGGYGQLESAWPVPGSILVREDGEGGTAYFVAGRSSFLDGGMRVFAIDPWTGELKSSHKLDGPWPGPETGAAADTPNRGFVIPGALPDVLVADTEAVYLRHLRFDPRLRKAEDMKPNLYVPGVLSGENRGGDHKYWDNLLDAPRHAVFNNPAYFHRSYFQNFPGARLYTTTGLLGGQWHSRAYWSYGQVTGQYLVFSGRRAYAVRQFATAFRDRGANAGEGYVVVAGETAMNEEEEKLFALRPEEYAWRIRVPLRPVAMALAGEKLILAGPPDSDDPKAALEALEGERRAVLRIVDASDGKKVSEMSLESPPVFDGLAVAGGRLYVSTRAGRLLCLGAAAR